MTSSFLQLRDDHQGFLQTNSAMTNGHRSPSIRSSKSRAIAIQRSRENAQSRRQILEETRQKEAAAEYDWATWRMYNRIVDYREKYPVKYEHVEEDKEDEAEEDTRTLVEKGVHSASEPTGTIKNNETESREPFRRIQMELPTKDLNDDYGEVFQLDL